MNAADLSLPSARWLIVPFILNVLILVPVCAAMLFGNGERTVFEGIAPPSEALRLMVGSLWTAILAASALGCIFPRFFAPVVLLQIVYKALWLLLFAWPQWRSGATVPTGITVCFFFIVATYPIFFALATRA
ncbi:MAG: hypothetical protein AAF411_00800 [Myxococcota bacterium]